MSRKHVFGDISRRRLRLGLFADVVLTHELASLYVDATSDLARTWPAIALAWIGTNGDFGLRNSACGLLCVAVMGHSLYGAGACPDARGIARLLSSYELRAGFVRRSHSVP
jgi:hypothetical protein